MTRDELEHAQRRHAIELHGQGVGFTAILERLGRSRGWLAKWLRRFAAEGWPGLRSHRRAPHRQPRAVAPPLGDRILALRQELEGHRTRSARFAGIGAEAIRLELERRPGGAVPALRTIERILQRHGYPHRAVPFRQGGGEPYPALRTRDPGDLHQTDLVGPRHLRGRHGVTRFYSLHTVAVVGRSVATSQARHKTAAFLCTHFVHAWQTLGVPRASQIDNEMAATGGGRYQYAFSHVMRLHLLCGVHLVFLPPGEPGRNPHVESFNALWQARVLRHPCPDLRALRQVSAAFLGYYHFRKPHRALRVATEGTRYPGVWLQQHQAALRPLPAGFSLTQYQDRQGRLVLPLARGRVSFIRKVDADGQIDLNGWAYFVGKRLTGCYVTATIFPHRQELVVKQAHSVYKRFPFCISEPVVAPLLLLPRGRI
jgi:transposase